MRILETLCATLYPVRLGGVRVSDFERNRRGAEDAEIAQSTSRGVSAQQDRCLA